MFRRPPSVAASKCVSQVLFKAMRKTKQNKTKKLAGQFESDKVDEDESVNESLSISQTKAFGEKSTISWVLH